MAKPNIAELLGKDAKYLLDHKSKTISTSQLHTPSGDFVDRVFINSNRSTQVLRNLQIMFDRGRLAGTGFLSILPIDQGIEHSAGASFANVEIVLPRRTAVRVRCSVVWSGVK